MRSIAISLLWIIWQVGLGQNFIMPDGDYNFGFATSHIEGDISYQTNRLGHRQRDYSYISIPFWREHSTNADLYNFPNTQGGWSQYEVVHGQLLLRRLSQSASFAKNNNISWQVKGEAPLTTTKLELGNKENYEYEMRCTLAIDQLLSPTPFIPKHADSVVLVVKVNDYTEIEYQPNIILPHRSGDFHLIYKKLITKLDIYVRYNEALIGDKNYYLYQYDVSKLPHVLEAYATNTAKNYSYYFTPGFPFPEFSSFTYNFKWINAVTLDLHKSTGIPYVKNYNQLSSYGTISEKEQLLIIEILKGHKGYYKLEIKNVLQQIVKRETLRPQEYLIYNIDIGSLPLGWYSYTLIDDKRIKLKPQYFWLGEKI